MSLPIRWSILHLEFRRDTESFEAAQRFWRQVAPNAWDHLTLDQVDGGQGPHDGQCRLELLLDQGSPLAAARDEALALGAVLDGEDLIAVQLRSPGGYRFSLSALPGPAPAVPPPAELEGYPNRVDQVCLDLPPDAATREIAFWQELTGWELRDEPDSEFTVLLRPADQPVRILLQRRDSADPGDLVTGHLDFSAGPDRRELAAVHQELGATLVGHMEEWSTLRDPAGRVYCLTRRDPA